MEYSLANSGSHNWYLAAHWPASRKGTKALSNIMDVVLWLIIGSALVLVIMNPRGFSQDVQAIGGFVTGESTILAGAPNKTGYKQVA